MKISKIKKLEELRQKELIMWWLEQHGVKVPENITYKEIKIIQFRIAARVKKAHGIQFGEPVGWV